MGWQFQLKFLSENWFKKKKERRRGTLKLHKGSFATYLYRYFIDDSYKEKIITASRTFFYKLLLSNLKRNIFGGGSLVSMTHSNFNDQYDLL